MAKKKKPGINGRPTTCTAAVYKAALLYLENYETKYEHPFPSLVGLCKVIGRGKTTIYNWALDDRKPEWKDLVDTINEVQEMVLLHKGLTGFFNPAITSLVLGKHGYHKKVDNEWTGKDGGPIQTKTLVVSGVDSKHPDSK